MKMARRDFKNHATLAVFPFVLTSSSSIQLLETPGYHVYMCFLFMLLAPLLFVQASRTPVVKVRSVV